MQFVAKSNNEMPCEHGHTGHLSLSTVSPVSAEGAAGPGLGLRSGRAIAQPHGAPALDAAAFEAQAAPSNARHQ